MRRILCATAVLSFLALSQGPAAAEGFLSGWYVKLGAAGIWAPEFEGSRNKTFRVSPLVSIGRAGKEARFSSRNDSPSLALIETSAFRAGVAGRLVWKRDGETSKDLEGLDPVKYGVELGGFADFYPTDWLRLRGELRHGIRSHSGLVADLSADAFVDVTPVVRLSAGPRATYATRGYSQAYYGVDATESARSGLSRYDPDGGWQSMGVGTALTWQMSDNLAASAFAEYKRLMGPAADSSLVRERGTRNQTLIGISATYKFGG